MTAGYSSTPLADKLGFKPGMRAFIADMPANVRAEIALDSLGLELLAAPGAGIDAAHVFVTERARLDCELSALRQLIAPSGFIWVSWPRRASGVETDITEDTIRDLALPLGLVDVKVCAVDETWSGLKLMIRKELR
ncbi:DUF3052 family protein [Sphingomonas koreensis]|uniref:DUF3052 family protein n=1 Tax=Sphingomonas koreensis TaxID=93064 RepID=UPI0008313570|nr:DUF3052 family protein [Sphingomonas koreensis]PJI87075.1 Protein of unknown function (DUF3052) [Sphingomonas koreensis]RSU60537.1 DUF3052 family protein [Sphingomonas koreensis]RSU69431.1 DUF3052 family protein [Sphingomonas koreensis]